MSENPLDRALSNLDSEEQRRSDEREGAERAAAQHREQIQDLVDDFVSRLQPLGFAGADWTGPKQGLFGKKLRGWSLTYESGDAWRRVPVTTDGRIPSFRPDRPEEYVRPVDSEFSPGAQAVSRLAESMAEVLRRHS